MLNGQDYYRSLAPYLESFSYTDNCDGKKADDLSFELADRDGKFISSWMPEKGVYVDCSIIASNWFMPYAGDLSLDCGRFWLDSIGFALPAHTVSVKGNSIPANARIKGSKEHRGWEKTSLKDIVTQIAGENQMEVDWQADINPRYIRTEMHDESPLSFLKHRALDAKLAIKIHRNKIVIFDEQKLEEAAAVFSLLYGNTAVAIGGASYRMAGGSFTTKITDTSKKSKVSATDPETGDTKKGEANAVEHDLEEDTGDQTNHDSDTDDGEGASTTAEGRELEGTDFGQGTSSGATLKAKSHLREKNKEKDKASVELSLGNPLIAAGQTFNLVGCGQFDGKWFVESAHHTVGPEYKTSLSIRKCLQGY
jgi:phage protein D